MPGPGPRPLPERPGCAPPARREPSRGAFVLVGFPGSTPFAGSRIAPPTFPEKSHLSLAFLSDLPADAERA
jgi:hypothetical protein